MLKRKEFILGAAVGLTFAAAATAGGIIDWPTASAQNQRAELRSGLVPASTAGAVLFQPPPGATSASSMSISSRSTRPSTGATPAVRPLISMAA